MRHHLTTRSQDGRDVTLRPLLPQDAPRVQEACSDPETVRWLGSDIINERYGLEHANGFIERALAHVEGGGFMSWAIADETSDVLLGHISLSGRHGELTDTAALGYWAHPAARGTGTTPPQQSLSSTKHSRRSPMGEVDCVVSPFSQLSATSGRSAWPRRRGSRAPVARARATG